MNKKIALLLLVGCLTVHLQGSILSLLKFYDTKYKTNNHLETNVANLYVAADGVGKSRGIVGAALTGMMAAEGIIEKCGK